MLHAAVPQIISCHALTFPWLYTLRSDCKRNQYNLTETVSRPPGSVVWGQFFWSASGFGKSYISYCWTFPWSSVNCQCRKAVTLYVFIRSHVVSHSHDLFSLFILLYLFFLLPSPFTFDVSCSLSVMVSLSSVFSSCICLFLPLFAVSTERKRRVWVKRKINGKS